MTKPPTTDRTSARITRWFSTGIANACVRRPIDRCGSHSRHCATTISLVEAFRNGTAQALSDLFSIAIRP